MINQAMGEFEQAKDRRVAAGDYVRASPWAALGIAVAAGMLLGFLATRR
jgi:ElaB/YqjD/DUF883 family membrane-anchored ribosome-binding protein